jgi:hypothetical protein
VAGIRLEVEALSRVRDGDGLKEVEMSWDWTGWASGGPREGRAAATLS